MTMMQHSTPHDDSLRVSANRLTNQCLTVDHQGLVTRSISELIFHAADRHACDSGKAFFWQDHSKPTKIAHNGRPC